MSPQDLLTWYRVCFNTSPFVLIGLLATLKLTLFPGISLAYVLSPLLCVLMHYLLIGIVSFTYILSVLKSRRNGSQKVLDKLKVPRKR